MYPIKNLVIQTVVIVLLSLASNAFAQQQIESTQAVSCIKKSQIKSIDILDNKNIVFQTGVNNYYLNRMPYACNGLRLNNKITYESSIDELCNVDVISVLNDAGPGLQTGPSCGLGKFEPIDQEEIKKLKDGIKTEERT